ncbi:16S rRNA (guanine(966)-N(2))-methyltransferase [Minicystis rosea]|nr:16S rRNA (guanine(966)-N(2))-methyltransferase [Minicystis rosea]
MRVIAGRLGGRRLTAPSGMATRPTSDRVREALFSALGDVEGVRVLDLFAGTGALGIEAVSRGASRAVFVENARPALTSLRENLSALALEAETRVVAAPAARAIATLASDGPFDLVFADPPYAALAEIPPLVAALVAASALAPDARFVLEHASRDAAPGLARLVARPSRTYGDTSITIYDTDAGDAPA